MQAAALCVLPSHLPIVAPARGSASPWTILTNPRLPTSLRPRPLIRTTALPDENSSVDYSSVTSVFPAEACETVGGEACAVEMYPEVKIKSETVVKTVAAESVDREYLEYDNAKTVFPAEACDDLGGEFCEPEYQKGVY